jgi:hypothetical protein
MQIPVLIESMPGNGFRVRGGEPFALVAEGATAEDALAQFRDRVSEKLRSGACVTSIEIESNEHSWLPFAGMYQQNDPLVQEWLDAVRLERDHAEAS